MSLKKQNGPDQLSQSWEQQSPNGSNISPYYIPYREEEVNPLEYWRAIKKRKWLIFSILLVTILTALGVSKIMPKKYEAEASLMPIIAKDKGGGGIGALAAQISSIPGLDDLVDFAGLMGEENQKIVNILESRTISEKIINRFDLLKVMFADQFDPKTNTFHPKFWKPIPVMEDGIKVFRKKYVDVNEDSKTGLVAISVTMKDAQLASKIANAMIFELQEFIESNSLTNAKRNRIFIEGQLVKLKTKLLEADKELNHFFSNNKISSSLPLIDVDVGQYKVLPKPFQEFQDDISKPDLQKIAEKSSEENLRVRNVPGKSYLEFLSFNRELLAKAVALLTQQYELAKIDEAKEELSFQVIDKAKVKIRPSSPNLILNIAIGIAGGFFIAIFTVFFLEYIEKIKAREKKKH